MQQVEVQLKRRMGIGSFLSERRLIDEITRTGMSESSVSLLYPLCIWSTETPLLEKIVAKW